jgi:hypothetical protein
MFSKPKNPPSLAEASIVYADKRWKEHCLHRVQKIVNWKSLARELEKLYNPTEVYPAWEAAGDLLPLRTACRMGRIERQSLGRSP